MTIATTPDKSLVTRGPDPLRVKVYVTSASRPPRPAGVLAESEGYLEGVGGEGDGDYQSSLGPGSNGGGICLLLLTSPGLQLPLEDCHPLPRLFCA